MPSIYLPVYAHADSQKGKCLAAQYAGMQSILVQSCVALAAVSEGRANPLWDLPEHIVAKYTDPDKAIATADIIAQRIIERFDIRNYNDWLDVRPTIERLYSSVAVFEDNDLYTEHVRFHDRWYTREWEKVTFKKPKGEDGFMLHLDDSDGNVGIAVAVDGAEFKSLKSGSLLYRKTSQNSRDKHPSLKAYKENGNWKKMMEVYSGFDLFKARDRSQLISQCAVEALESAAHLIIMSPGSREETKFNLTNGFNEVVELLELAALQTRHRDLEKRVFVDHAATYGLKAQCESANPAAEMAAMLTAFYRPDLVRSKKKKTVKSK
uniref:Uncharacterized protein n=1 Tax=Pseudomonas phage HRDY3 TaxID=3236930 RepID=A0AB39CEA9_9VIRU